MNGRTAINLCVTRAAASVAVGALVALGIGGCAARPVEPRPGAAVVVLEVGAKPKSGGAERFARVPVYDAAPRPAAASGQFERVDYAALDDIVVWLEPAADVAGATPATLPAPLLVQIDPAKTSDDVRAASVGQEIVFHNRGNTPASLYSVSDDNDFESLAIDSGGSGRYTVRAPGLIEVLADPSQPPVAVIYAVPTPWVACTCAGESVVFRDVPPGAYQALSWHPRLPGKSASLSLAPDQVTRSTLDVGVKNISAEGSQR